MSHDQCIYSTYGTVGTLVDELVSDSMDPELPELELPSAANASRSVATAPACASLSPPNGSQTLKTLFAPSELGELGSLEADAVSISTRPET